MVEVEWVVGIIRGGPSFVRHGDPFEFSCTMVRSGSTCELKGFSGKMTMAAAREIRAALNQHGITTATWERIRPDHVKTIVRK